MPGNGGACGAQTEVTEERQLGHALDSVESCEAIERRTYQFVVPLSYTTYHIQMFKVQTK